MADSRSETACARPFFLSSALSNSSSQYSFLELSSVCCFLSSTMRLPSQGRPRGSPHERCRLVQDEHHGDNPANETKSESTSDNQLTVADGDNYQGGTPSQELRSMTKGISTAGMSSDRAVAKIRAQRN